MELTELPDYEEGWHRLASGLRDLLGSFGARNDSLILSFAGAVREDEEWNPEWDFQNGPWINIDVDLDGRIRTSCGSNHFLAEPFQLNEQEIDQMRSLGFAEPVEIDLEGRGDFSWNYYFLRLDEPGPDLPSQLTEAIVNAFRGPYRAPHASLLKYMAWGPCTASAKALGLTPSW
jgi:hypothetical protein